MRSAGDEKQGNDDGKHYEKAFHDHLEKSVGADRITDFKERDACDLMKHLIVVERSAFKGD